MVNKNEKTSSPIRLASKTENVYPILKNKFTHEVKFSIFNEELLTTQFAQAIPNNLWKRYYPKNILQAFQETIEVAIPFDALSLKEGDEMSFCVVESRDGTIEETYPQDIMISLTL